MSESDWDYINETWGHDSDGMPNFMSSSDFFDDHSQRSKKNLAPHDFSRIENEYYEDGGIKIECQFSSSNKRVSSTHFFENGVKNCHINYWQSEYDVIENTTFFYENGNSSFQMNYTNSGKYSSLYWWHENGKLSTSLECFNKMESNYNENGMKTSEGKFSTEDYESFKKEGKWSFCFTDKDDEHFLNEYTQYYRDDKREGEFCSFDLHGNVREKGYYKDDKMHGKWLQFDKRMMIVKDHFYQGGKLIVKNPQYE